MLHAITIHPLTVIATDMIIKSIPVGSKNKKGRNILHNIVKRGEKRNMTRVFLPIKQCSYFIGRNTLVIFLPIK